MIPISDYPGERRRTFPVATIGIIIINVLVFLLELALGPNTEVFIQTFGTIPYEITRGIDIPPFVPGFVYLTLVSAVFLHGGFVHIGFNMLFLWIFGDNVEDAFGHVGFLIFYLATGVLASLTHVFFNASSQIPSIGASGAVAGVMAAYMILFPRAEVRVLLFLGIFVTVTRISALVMIVFWFVLQLLSGLASLGVSTEQTAGVAFWAHIGGFMAGLILAKFFQAFKGKDSTW